MTRCPRTGPSSSSTSSMSPPSIRPSSPTGARASWRQASSDPRPNAWWISATMRRAPISSRSSRASFAPRSSPASISTIPNMAMTISTRVPSIRSACSSYSMNWSMPSCAKRRASRPAYMIDQSHNVTDPIESLMQSAIEIAARLCPGVAGRPRRRSPPRRTESDVLGGHRLIKQAFITDVTPILAEARRRKGGAIDPIADLSRLGLSRPQSKGASGLRGGGSRDCLSRFSVRQNDLKPPPLL